MTYILLYAPRRLERLREEEEGGGEGLASEDATNATVPMETETPNAIVMVIISYMNIHVIGRAGASPPSRATGLNFLYNYIYIYITGYGSTLYIGIAMVFVLSPYIWKFTFCFQFQVNLTFNDFTAQNMSKVFCVPLNYHFLAKL